MQIIKDNILFYMRISCSTCNFILISTVKCSIWLIGIQLVQVFASTAKSINLPKLSPIDE